MLTNKNYLISTCGVDQRPPLEFFAMIQGRVLARDLFVAYARYENLLSTLLDICETLLLMKTFLL